MTDDAAGEAAGEAVGDAGREAASEAAAVGALARRIAEDLLPVYPGEGPAVVPEPARAALAAAGLLDGDLPPLARVEVARALGARSPYAACELLGLDATAVDDPVLAGALAGAGERAVALGWAYAREREAFGRPLATFQVQRHAFAGAQTDVGAALALARRAVMVGDPVDVSTVARVAVDAAWAAVDAALQVHGGYGYSEEYPVSALWRELARLRAGLTSRTG